MRIGSALTRVAMGADARLMRAAAGVDRHSPAGPLAADVRDARALLVVALAEIGDAVMLSALLRELRGVAPLARVTLVVRPSVRALFEPCPYVDEIVEYEPRCARALRPLVLPARARRFARARLAGRRFDVAVVPRWDVDHHFALAVALFSGAPRRVGFGEHVTARKSRLNAGFSSLLTDVVRGAPVAHEVERMVEIASALGASEPSAALELWLSDADRLTARAVTERPGVASGAPVVALGIGAADPKRRWPVERFAVVGRALQAQIGAHVLVIGGPGDVAPQHALLAALESNAAGLAGKLTLRETSAVLERCRLYIGNDSGPLHLAAAVDVPCVELSCHPRDGDPQHNNAPERFGPWGVPHAVIRPAHPSAPCDASCRAREPHCILQLEAMDVVGRAIALAASTGATSELTAGRGP